ncbi:MAG: hypothetical protein QOD53_1318, partial [Thermoleophilaceae bacterium]|nr:hypothetical protein [Thermoleophilaceae bacterium]
PRFDAFWIVAGRVVDWGELPAGDELAERTRAALERRPPRRAAVPAEEVDEVRIVHSWLAAHEPPQLALEGAPARARLEEWVAGATGG